MLDDLTIRRRRYPSLTSLIDIIFLLLLFFMLSSTFSKFKEVDISAAASGAGATADRPELFIALSETHWKLNGEAVAQEGVAFVLQKYRSDTPVKAVLHVGERVSSQSLVDALEILNRENIQVTLVR